MLPDEPICDPDYAIQVAVEMEDPDQMRDFLLAYHAENWKKVWSFLRPLNAGQANAPA